MNNKANQAERLQQFDQTMENYFMTETTQTKAEFWWNHLSFNQRMFIYRDYLNKPIVWGTGDFNLEAAHLINWQSVQGYPK